MPRSRAYLSAEGISEISGFDGFRIAGFDTEQGPGRDRKQKEFMIWLRKNGDKTGMRENRLI